MMNAPVERGQESYNKVQLVVLMDEILGGTADENTFAMMRAVSEHLPEKARTLWVDVEQVSEQLDKRDYDISALTTAEREKIEALRSSLKDSMRALSDFIDTFLGFLDPETVTELNTAMSNKDVTCVNSILESCAEAKERRETRVEE